MKKQQRLIEEKEMGGPLSLAWSNPEPQPFTIGLKADMRVVNNCNPKPALINDAFTGKKLHVLSFKWGDALEVQKPEAIGLTEKATLPILAYGYDEDQDLYAITEGTMPVDLRTKAIFPETHEVVFEPLPTTISEYCIQNFNDVFTLVRGYKYQPEVNPVTKQILLPFNDLAA